MQGFRGDHSCSISLWSGFLRIAIIAPRLSSVPIERGMIGFLPSILHPFLRSLRKFMMAIPVVLMAEHRYWLTIHHQFPILEPNKARDFGTARLDRGQDRLKAAVVQVSQTHAFALTPMYMGEAMFHSISCGMPEITP
jgi:hypothetical protein